MKKPLVLKKKDEIIISFNGKKLVVPMNERYENMNETEIADDFLTNKNVLRKEVI